MTSHASLPSAPSEPIDLAVHGHPDPNDPRVVDTPPSGRGKLLAIVVACSLPVVLAYFIFNSVRPAGQVGFGALIHPVRPVPEVSLRTPQGQEVALPSLRQQWLLVSVGPSACDEVCAKHLFIQRQLREMLNKDKDRVDRVWLTTDDGPISEQLTALLQDTLVLRTTPEVLQQWLGAEASQAAPQLFVVDPHGNAMLHMPADQNTAEARAALRVLQRLLSASGTWDMPGR